MKTVALVACVSKKNAIAMPARDLYVSTWFRQASLYASRIADSWCILSAKYGLVAPETVIEPYDETLNRMPVAARRVWARRVLADLEQLLEAGDRVVFLAGQRYRQDLIEPIRRMGSNVEIPMKGLRIGEQLHWLKKQIR